MDVLLATGEQTTIALTAMAINALGKKAVSLTGAQAGIITDGFHTKAKIANITPKQIHQLSRRRQHRHRRRIPGRDHAMAASPRSAAAARDLTAIAIASAIKADLCQIFTDVDGVYTCDPRIVPNARKLAEISYDEMLEMAQQRLEGHAVALGRVRQEIRRHLRSPQQLSTTTPAPS